VNETCPTITENTPNTLNLMEKAMTKSTQTKTPIAT